MPEIDTNQGPGEIQVYRTPKGATIFQLPLEEFPGMWGFAYLILVKDNGGDLYRVLVDTGSGIGESNRGLEAGFQAASRLTGQEISFSSLTHILITHGHIDHIGGLSYICPRTTARIGVHELDRRILTNYEERLTIISRRLGEFLLEAGVSFEQRENLLAMYQFTKSLFHSVSVDFTLEAAGMRLGPFQFFHVPGHSAGHVVIRLDDIILSGDHVLNQTSPHQSPEHLTLSTGLDHYLHSLETFKNWAGNPRLTLGGHKTPIIDLSSRIDEIRRLHEDRLQQVLDLLPNLTPSLKSLPACFQACKGITSFWRWKRLEPMWNIFTKEDCWV
jgi:glyoxylase-like metal-dependent hydrolase (beta-lactamase superfamily II)